MKRVLTVLGLMMIGEGLVVVIHPRHYMALWRGGPRFCREIVEWFSENPETTRTIGAVELVAGLLLALRGMED